MNRKKLLISSAWGAGWGLVAPFVGIPATLILSGKGSAPSNAETLFLIWLQFFTVTPGWILGMALGFVLGNLLPDWLYLYSIFPLNALGFAFVFFGITYIVLWFRTLREKRIRPI